MSDAPSIDDRMLDALEADVLRRVLERPGGMTEHELILALRQEGDMPLAEVPARDNLALFRLHFVLFHVLYRLRDRLLAERSGVLHIHTLSIRLGPYVSGAEGLEPTDPLRTYYLDLRQLDTTAEQVDALLEGFWHRMDAHGEKRWALGVLELNDDADYPAVRRRYRHLAMRHHPDRGGSTERIQEIHAAMSVLARCYRE